MVDWGEEGSLKIFCAVLAWSRWYSVRSRPTADAPRPSRCSPNDKGASARSIRDANNEVGVVIGTDAETAKLTWRFDEAGEVLYGCQEPAIMKVGWSEL